MCLFKKHQKIDLPYLIFGLIALGIIISTVVLVLNLREKMENRSKSFSEFSAQMQAKEKQVAADYLLAVTNLKSQVEKSKNSDEALALAEKVFFSVKVPQSHLDLHLKTWLAINRIKDLELGTRKETLVKILNEFVEEVKK
jgi:hypothetical protein